MLAQQPKWGIHNSIVDYSNLAASPLPTTPNPDYTQNAVWDVNGNLVLYEADGVIYNKNGGVILNIENEAKILYGINPITSFTLKGFSEFIFVPVPGECDQYYGINSYSNGSYYINPFTLVTDIVWCKIDVSNGLGTAVILPQTGLRVAKEDINCDNRSTETENKRDFAIHLETTKALSNGNRYLFAANGNCVSVLSINNYGVSYIDGYQNSGAFLPNLRSEMEVFKNEDTYEIAMSYYEGSTPWDYLTIFEFNMSGTSPIMSHYDVELPSEENTRAIVKGLEFSSDGLTLYASIMTLNNTGSSVISGNNVIYVSRGGLNQPFQYDPMLNFGGSILTGSGTMDFGIGMIEKGVDGKLWFVGNNRLANLADENNPLSAVNISAQTISNHLSYANAYNNSTFNLPATDLDIWSRQLYLLIDQIDGENYSSWTIGSDLYPPFLETCLFPYTFPFNLPSNAIITYTGQSTMSNGTLIFQTAGTLTISYQNKYGCDYTESVNIFLMKDPWCESEFTHAITETVDPDVVVTASCDNPGSTIHEYYLYESNGTGGWILLDNCFTANCALTGVYNGQTFKIVHDVYNINSQCHPFETTNHLFTIL